MTHGTFLRFGCVALLAAAGAWVLTHHELVDVEAIGPAVRKLGVLGAGRADHGSGAYFTIRTTMPASSAAECSIAFRLGKAQGTSSANIRPRSSGELLGSIASCAMPAIGPQPSAASFSDTSCVLRFGVPRPLPPRYSPG
jgi:hypothetical protein